MQRKSVGLAIPALPEEALEDLRRLGIEQPERLASEDFSVGSDSEFDFDLEEENYSRRVGPADVTTWLGTGAELPVVFFASRELVDGKSWLIRGELIPNTRTELLQLVRLAVEPWEHDGEVTGSI